MASRQKARPYRELGALLEGWRDGRYNSALALFKENKFSFSYTLYTEFEKGVTLPPVAALLELVAYFKQSPDKALLLWAKVQVPKPYQKVFEMPAIPEADQEREESHSPSFDNTWVFGHDELARLKISPWLWELLLAASVAYPLEVPLEELPCPSDVAIKDVLEGDLRSWIDHRFLLCSENGLRLRLPHIHIPKSEEWMEVRNGNTRRALDALLDATSYEAQAKGGAYRELIHRPLTQRQAQKWVTVLRNLENQFKAEPYLDDPSRTDSTHALLVVFSARPLKKPV